MMCRLSRKVTTMVVMTSLAYLGSCALSTIGFSSAGPVAGTYAATWMSSLALTSGAIAKGSTYALLQTAALGGAPVIAAGIGAVAVAITLGGAGAVAILSTQSVHHSY